MFYISNYLMLEQDLRPTTQEVSRWLLDTLRHVCNIEYFLERLSIGNEDPERPHDIMGEGNKLSWEVIKGFSLQYRNKSPEFFDKYVKPSLEAHRQGQFHHRKWNEPNLDATADNMKLGAIDTICALLEDREYQGGSYTYDQMADVLEKKSQHKIPWVKDMIIEMRKLPQPALKGIYTLHDFPNIGITREKYSKICDRIRETTSMLRKEGYNDIVRPIFI